MLPAAKLKPKLVKLITEKLNVEVKIKGLVNDFDESTRLAFIFEQSTDLDCAISQVLFNKPYDPDEELSTEHTNEFNLYLLFFKGIGGNNFYFNESSLIDDIKHSVTLNDYCQRDHAYQQSAFAKETENYQIKNYQFSCDYWVRYINIAHELVYATVRSADMDLYWRLEELSRHRVEQAIPHTIKLINLEPDKDEKTTPMEIIVNAQGKEEQLTQLEAFCRDTITKLTQSYCEQISHAEPCVSIYYQEDECTEQHVILVVNNEQAAQQIQLRDFINSIKTLTVPMAIIERDHDDFLQQFTGLFDAEVKRLNE